MTTNNTINSPIPTTGANGGTGVVNTGKTITLGGSFTTSGAFDSTFTMTNTTSVTFPTSGTLATTATANVISVSGTTNRITVSPTTGNAIVDISASYVGQSSITTLGTISTGVWNGTIVGATYGGTGVNNGASTITIGGNVAFSGAFTFAGTITGNTAVTFPTSGTLATTAQILTPNAVTASQSLVANNSYYITSGGALVLTLPTTAAAGTVIQLIGNGSTSWSIAQNASQSMWGGNVQSTVGVGGSIASTNAHDGITLICVVANLTWQSINYQGFLTIT